MKEESLLLLSDLQKLINQVVLIDYTIIILGGNSMNEKLELTEEEVNVYSDDCGKIQVDCLNDCIDGSAWLSIES